MAQLPATLSTEVAVTVPVLPAVMKLAGAALGFEYSPSAASEHMSVPPLTVPAVKEGVPMAMAVVEPSEPESR